MISACECTCTYDVHVQCVYMCRNKTVVCIQLCPVCLAGDTDLVKSSDNLEHIVDIHASDDDDDKPSRHVSTIHVIRQHFSLALSFVLWLQSQQDI